MATLGKDIGCSHDECDKKKKYYKIKKHFYPKIHKI